MDGVLAPAVAALILLLAGLGGGALFLARSAAQQTPDGSHPPTATTVTAPAAATSGPASPVAGPGAVPKSGGSSPEPSPPAAEPIPTAGDTPRQVRVANTEGQGANLRREPSLASQRVKVVREGTLLDVIGDDRELAGRVWRQVQDESGDAGWIPGELLVEEREARPRPPPTPVPLTIRVSHITSPVARGQMATLVIVTSPDIRCEVRPLLYGPATMPREGLEPKVSDERGECAWTWTVPSDATPGNWRYQVVVGTGERQVTREITFGVT